MNWTLPIVITSVTLVGVGAYFALNWYKKRNMEKLFNQILDLSKQVPKQKKHSFLLLMFKESLTPKKKNAPNPMDRLNNPKYLEVQLIQMTQILKDPNAVTDKKLKNAIRIFNDYQAWEKAKYAAQKKVS